MSSKSQHKYQLGEIARSCDINISQSKDVNAEIIAHTLQRGDGAFILRHDRTWRYAIVAEVVHKGDTNTPYLIFVVQSDGSTKRVNMCHWGGRVRPVGQKQLMKMKVVQCEGHQPIRRGIDPEGVRILISARAA